MISSIAAMLVPTGIRTDMAIVDIKAVLAKTKKPGKLLSPAF
jgi:hypothetical protein